MTRAFRNKKGAVRALITEKDITDHYYIFNQSVQSTTFYIKLFVFK